jgi:hypothetical protein
MKKHTYTPQIEARLELLPDDDEQVVRRQEKLTPREIADRQAEQAGIVAAKRAERAAVRDVGVAGAVNDEEIEHLEPRARRAGSRRVAEQEPEPTPAPTPKALKDAEEDVRRIDQRLAEIDKALSAARKAQREAAARQEAEHRSQLDAIRAEKAAAEAEANRLHAEAERAQLAARIADAQAYRQAQRDEEARTVAERNLAHHRRVAPVLESVKRASAALRVLVKDHGPSLLALSQLDHRQLPASWNAETQIAFNRCAADAFALYGELTKAASGYSENVPRLQQLLASGWSSSRDYEMNLANAIRYLDTENTSSIVQSFQQDIARISSRLSEFDLAPGLSQQRAVHAEREQEREHERARSRQRGPVPTSTVIPPSTGGVDQQQFAEGM